MAKAKTETKAAPKPVEKPKQDPLLSTSPTIDERMAALLKEHQEMGAR